MVFVEILDLNIILCMRQFIINNFSLTANMIFKKCLFLFFGLMYFFDCIATTLPGCYSTQDSIKQKILIISSYDVQSIKARKNKKELFAELVITLQKDLAAEIKSKTDYEPLVISEMLTGENYDSLLASLIQKNKAAKTIIIKAFDILNKRVLM